MQRVNLIRQNQEQSLHMGRTRNSHPQLNQRRLVYISNILRQSLTLTTLSEISKCPTGEVMLASKNVINLAIMQPGMCNKLPSNDRLKEQFSRLQYARSNYASPPTHAVTKLTIPLKNGARTHTILILLVMSQLLASAQLVVLRILISRLFRVILYTEDGITLSD